MVSLFTRLLLEDGTIASYCEDTFTIQEGVELNPVHVEDCKRHGAELLNRTTHRCYGYYKLICGHTTFLHYGAVRKAKTSNFKCKECLDIKLTKEADALGLLYHKDVKVTSINDSRYYTFPCGHSRVLKTANVRFNQAACVECKEEQFTKEAEALGLKMLTFESDKATRLYQLPCGHEKKINLTSVREKSFKCRICQENKYADEAKEAGIELLQIKSSHHDYRVYKLQCGCVKELTMPCVRSGSFECKTHSERTIDFTQPISVYLVKFSLPIGDVLKLGFAMDTTGRFNRYYLKGTVTPLIIRTFCNGQDAVDLEKKLHAKYKHKALDKSDMSAFMLNGFTECYPMELEETLTNEINKGGSQ